MAFDSPPLRGFARAAMRSELLDAETERALALAWRDRRDEAAMHRMVNAHMRLAISMAMKFRRYGLPVGDLIQEAGLGLLKAADRFDPDRGVRFSTYAMYWIRASVQDYVLRNWSLVRTGSTTGQKSLFFNLRRVQAEIEREARDSGEVLAGDELRARIAARLGVSESDVAMMDGRMSGADLSLNARQGGDAAGDETGREWLETIADAAPGAETQVQHRHDRAALRGWLVEAMSGLTPREKAIVQARRIDESPRTLGALGAELGLSKERVRQIEAAALARMRRALEARGPEVYALLA